MNSKSEAKNNKKKVNHDDPSNGRFAQGYNPKGYRSASKGVGFHSVQTQPLTHLRPLKGICTTCHP